MVSHLLGKKSKLITCSSRSGLIQPLHLPSFSVTFSSFTFSLPSFQNKWKLCLTSGPVPLLAVLFHTVFFLCFFLILTLSKRWVPFTILCQSTLFISSTALITICDYCIVFIYLNVCFSYQNVSSVKARIMSDLIMIIS